MSLPSFDAPTLFSLTKLIHVNAKLGRASNAQKAFNLIEKLGFVPDTTAKNTLMHAYARDVGKIIEIFESIDEPDIVSFSTLITGLVADDKLDHAYLMLDKMRAKKLVPNQIIYTTLIKGCLSTKQVPRAWRTFEHLRSISVPDRTLFTLMIYACVSTRDAEKVFIIIIVQALDLFQEMQDLNLSISAQTYSTLVCALSTRPDYYTETLNIFHQMVVDGYTIDTAMYAALIDSCGMNRDLRRVKVLWNDLITRCNETNTQERILQSSYNTNPGLDDPNVLKNVNNLVDDFESHRTANPAIMPYPKWHEEDENHVKDKSGSKVNSDLFDLLDSTDWFSEPLKGSCPDDAYTDSNGIEVQTTVSEILESQKNSDSMKGVNVAVNSSLDSLLSDSADLLEANIQDNYPIKLQKSVLENLSQKSFFGNLNDVVNSSLKSKIEGETPGGKSTMDLLEMDLKSIFETEKTPTNSLHHQLVLPSEPFFGLEELVPEFSNIVDEKIVLDSEKQISFLSTLEVSTGEHPQSETINLIEPESSQNANELENDEAEITKFEKLQMSNEIESSAKSVPNQLHLDEFDRELNELDEYSLKQSFRSMSLNTSSSSPFADAPKEPLLVTEKILKNLLKAYQVGIKRERKNNGYWLSDKRATETAAQEKLKNNDDVAALADDLEAGASITVQVPEKSSSGLPSWLDVPKVPELVDGEFPLLPTNENKIANMNEERKLVWKMIEREFESGLIGNRQYLVHTYMVLLSNNYMPGATEEMLDFYRNGYTKHKVRINGRTYRALIESLTSIPSLFAAHIAPIWQEFLAWDKRAESELSNTKSAYDNSSGKVSAYLLENERERKREIEHRDKASVRNLFVRMACGHARNNDLDSAIEVIKLAEKFRYEGYLSKITINDVQVVLKMAKLKSEEGNWSYLETLLELCPKQTEGFDRDGQKVSQATNQIREIVSLKTRSKHWWGWDAMGANEMDKKKINRLTKVPRTKKQK